MTKEEFEKLTPEKKRVGVAEDVLAQLAADKLCAVRGAWVSLKDGHRLVEKRPDTFAEVVDQRACESCAIGSVFLSIARILQLKTEGLINFMGDIQIGDMLRLMEPYFEPTQLAMMEVAFEGSSITYDYSELTIFDKPSELTPEQFNAARAFGDWSYEYDEDGEEEEVTSLTPRQVLAKIMQNVVENGGEFRP